MGAFSLILISWSAGVIAAFFAIRYGLVMGRRLDQYFQKILQSRFSGFTGYFRIPFQLGLIIEFCYYLIIGRTNYQHPNWWPLKYTGFVAILLFPALLISFNNTTFLLSGIIYPDGLVNLFETNTFLSWYLVVLLALESLILTMLVAESLLMHYFLAPVRIALYAVLATLFGILSLISLVVLLLYPLVLLIARLGAPNPYTMLRRQYDTFIVYQETWREKRRFFQENKRNKKIQRTTSQGGI
jgi:hypothetical protein